MRRSTKRHPHYKPIDWLVFFGFLLLFVGMFAYAVNVYATNTFSSISPALNYQNVNTIISNPIAGTSNIPVQTISNIPVSTSTSTNGFGGSSTSTSYSSSIVGGQMIPWQQTYNVGLLDGQYAVVSYYMTGTASGAGANVPTSYLAAEQFGTFLPQNAIISGIYIQVVDHYDLSGNPPGIQGGGYCNNSAYVCGSVVDNSVKLIVNGTIQGTEHGYGTWSLGSDTVWSYGGSTDTWGLPLTAYTIMRPDFGVGVSALIRANVGGGASVTVTAKIDFINLTVFYTLPSGQSVSIQQQLLTSSATLNNGQAYTWTFLNYPSGPPGTTIMFASTLTTPTVTTTSQSVSLSTQTLTVLTSTQQTGTATTGTSIATGVITQTILVDPPPITTTITVNGQQQVTTFTPFVQLSSQPFFNGNPMITNAGILAMLTGIILVIAGFSPILVRRH